MALTMFRNCRLMEDVVDLHKTPFMTIIRGRTLKSNVYTSGLLQWRLIAITNKMESN